MKKSPREIKDKMWFWHFGREPEKRLRYTGRELFTLYELISEKTQLQISERAQFQEEEIPVYSLKVGVGAYIISTTHRFIRIDKDQLDALDYQDFVGHIGFQTNIRASSSEDQPPPSSLAFRQPDGKIISVKTEGYIQDFGLQTRTGAVMYWPIPTGQPGFSFWNATLKCSVIGREYL
jgi:hypothetical protein